MIKKGDKVVCIEKHIVYGFLSKHTYKENNIYEVLKTNVCGIFVNDEENAGIWFSLKEKDKHFITLAELRENQIKTVLND